MLCREEGGNGKVLKDYEFLLESDENIFQKKYNNFQRMAWLSPYVLAIYSGIHLQGAVESQKAHLPATNTLVLSHQLASALGLPLVHNYTRAICISGQ